MKRAECGVARRFDASTIEMIEEKLNDGFMGQVGSKSRRDGTAAQGSAYKSQRMHNYVSINAIVGSLHKLAWNVCNRNWGTD